jgi:hypothetical protein
VVEPERGEDEYEAAAQQSAVRPVVHERNHENGSHQGEKAEHGVRDARAVSRHFQADRPPNVSGLAEPPKRGGVRLTGFVLGINRRTEGGGSVYIGAGLLALILLIVLLVILF